MSLRTLKRRVKVLGLNKSHATASAAVIKQIIKREIEEPSMLRGYRSMWNKLRTTYNIIARIDSVMEILREADLLHSNERRSGNLERRYHSNDPNDTWHVDGFDKCG